MQRNGWSQCSGMGGHNPAESVDSLQRNEWSQCGGIRRLIFFSAVTALEPVFEARQQTTRLKRMTLVVALANLILNLNLIPFAGIEGAAMATAGAMFVYFFLFFRLLPPDLRGVRIAWPGAAAALYLTYVLMSFTGIGIIFSLMVVPTVFGAVLWMVGFFNPLPGNKPMEHTPPSST